jgi:GTPase SAR1 family protein
MKTFHTQQTEFLKLCSILIPISKKYDYSSTDLEAWVPEIENYHAYVPLIGVYSSGKSSLLNTFLGSKVFKKEITPCTDIPFEISWGENDKYEIRHSDSVQPVTLKEIQEGTYTARPDSVISMVMNNDNLEKYKNLALVDLPGLNAGIDAHSKAIDFYIHKSAAYLLVIDPKTNLRKDLVDFLLELSAFSVPVYCIITKKDKIRPATMKEIIAQISQQIRDSFGRDADGIGVTSAMEFGNDVSDLHKSLASLEERCGEMLHNQYHNMFIKVISDLEQGLRSRIENSQLDDSELDKQEHELKMKNEEAVRKLQSTSEHQQSLIQQSAGKLLDHIQQALESNVSSLASARVSGSDISNQIGQIYRRAFMDGYQTYVSPMLTEYSKKLSMLVPDVQIGQIENVKEAPESGTSDKGGDAVGKVVATKALAKIAMAIPVVGPYIAIAIKVFGYLSALFGGKGSTSNKENQIQQMENQIRHETIPRIIAELHNPIISHLNDVTTEMQQCVEKAIADQTENYQKSRDDIKQSRMKKVEEFEADKLMWQNDLAELGRCHELLS